MSNHSNESRGYAKAAQTNKPPFEQAIIIDRLKGPSHEDYILALLKISDPANFFTTDIISKDRIIVWCKSKSIADGLVGKTIVVAGHKLTIRYYVTPNKRVLFSHCFPHIEDDFLVSELNKCGVRTIGPIHTLNAGFKTPSIKHYTSHKRQVYIPPEDEDKLPENIKTIIFGTEITVWISTGVVKCFECKQLGHIAKNCPLRVENTVITSTDTQTPVVEPTNLAEFTPTQPQTSTPDTTLINQSPTLSKSPPPPKTPTPPEIPSSPILTTLPKTPTKDTFNTPENDYSDLLDLPYRTSQDPSPGKLEMDESEKTLSAEKRLYPFPSSSSSATTGTETLEEKLDTVSETESNVSNTSMISQAEKKKKKKKKSPKKKVKKNEVPTPDPQDKPPELEDQWRALEPYINDHDEPLALPYDQFLKLLNETTDYHDILKNAEKYTTNMVDLEVMFDYVSQKHPGSIAERNHFSRIRKVLREHNSRSVKEPPKVAHQDQTGEKMED